MYRTQLFYYFNFNILIVLTYFIIILNIIILNCLVSEESLFIFLYHCYYCNNYCNDLKISIIFAVFRYLIKSSSKIFCIKYSIKFINWALIKLFSDLFDIFCLIYRVWCILFVKDFQYSTTTILKFLVNWLLTLITHCDFYCELRYYSISSLTERISKH